MLGKIIKLLCNIAIFAGVMWRFGCDWRFSLSQQFDEAAFIMHIAIIMISSFALSSSVVEIVRELQKRHREKEENRIGPDL